MKNICVLSFSALLFTSVNFGGVPSLGYLSTESLIVKNELSDESKKILNEVLENNRIESKFLDFSNRPIRDKDLSGLCLKNFNFSNSQLINVNLERCDLTETNLEGAVFEKVKLDKAILYTPVDELGRPVLDKSFKFDSKLSDYDLVILYSNLMKRNSPRAKALNKILGCLQLNLQRCNLEGRNLTGINLKEASLFNANLRKSILIDVNLEGSNLKEASFQEARLSDHLQIPNYRRAVDLKHLYNSTRGQEKILYDKVFSKVYYRPWDSFEGLAGLELLLAFNDLDLNRFHPRYDLDDAVLTLGKIIKVNLSDVDLRDFVPENKVTYKALLVDKINQFIRWMNSKN